MSSSGTRPVGLAWKRLSPVEVDPSRSRQHEFHAGGLQTILGRPIGKDTRPATYHYWRPEHPRPLTASSTFTFYDARENHPSRTELRLYYPSNSATRWAGPGDLFLIVFGKDNLANVHIVKHGSPRWSSLLNSLSQSNAAPSNTLHVFQGENVLESEILSNALSFLPSAGDEEHIGYEIERSALVAAACAELVSNGERPSQRAIAAAVRSIQREAWPTDSIDGALARRMILERHVHQEIEVLRLQGSRTTALHQQRLRSAVQISAAHLQASERHLGQAFVGHVLDALGHRLDPGSLRIHMRFEAAAFVAIGKSNTKKETLILVCGQEYPENYLEDSAVRPDWILTQSFPSADSVEKLMGLCATTKLASARMGRASQATTSDIWGPDLDALVRASA